ncbi:MAG: hypothetical protein JJ956_06370 [Pseudomonadales bacterium]|nr:hypothetical protein [Pseudomonadales bacterium]
MSSMKTMKLSPILLAGLGFVLALAVLALTLLASISSANLGFKAEAENDVIVISEVLPWLQEKGVAAGDIVTGVRSKNGYAEFFPRHLRLGLGNDRQNLWQEVKQIREILSAREVILIRESANPVTYEVADGHNILELPANFWVRCAFGLLAFFVGLSLWIWRPMTTLNMLGMAAGTGLMLAWLPSAPLLSGIPMHFPPVEFAKIATSLQSGGILLFAASFVCIPLYFPRRLPYAGFFAQVVCILAVAYMLFHFALNPTGDSWLDVLLLEPRDIFLPVVPMLLVICGGIAIQSYRNWAEPVARAQQLWFIFAATAGPTIWLLLYLLPSRYGDGPIIPISYAPVTILTSYVMTMVGIWRHPALNFERHIETIYQWWLTSILFLVIDLVLIYYVAFSPEKALLATLVILLWAYLPIRQWLVDKVNHRNRSSYRLSINKVITDLVEASFSQAPVEIAWQKAIYEAFRPVNIVNGDHGPTEIRDRGRLLHVAESDFSTALVLDSADRGRRLFNEDDVSVVVSLRNLLDQLIERGGSFQAGQLIERQRISRDLHDQIGGKILSIIYSAKDTRSRELAQETMDQLREVLRALKKEPVPVSNLEAEIKQLAEDVCRSHQLTLRWTSKLTDGAALITTTHYLNLLNIIRELLTNTVRHAGAQSIDIELSQDIRSLYLRFRDDGSGFDWHTISPGNGLRNIESRIQEINGSISWGTTNQTLIEILILLTRDGASMHDRDMSEVVHG